MYLCMDNCGLRKLCHDTLLIEINNVVDDGPLFIAPLTDDAIQGLRLTGDMQRNFPISIGLAGRSYNSKHCRAAL